MHRKHHQKCEQPGDPHSPQVYGFWTVLLGGAFLYASATEDKKMIQQYGKGTPDDWMERNVYTPYNKWGFLLLLIIEVALFHGWGLVMWLVQMAAHAASDFGLEPSVVLAQSQRHSCSSSINRTTKSFLHGVCLAQP